MRKHGGDRASTPGTSLIWHSAVNPSCEELRHQLLHLLDASPPSSPDGWTEIWNAFVENPWYRGRVAFLTRSILVKGNAPLSWSDDIQQDAILLLARDLRERRDLGLNRARPEAEFEGWINTIISHHIRQALRRMRRTTKGVGLVESMEPVQTHVDMEARFDLEQAVEQLADPDKTIIRLFSHGYSIVEIAHSLHLTYRQTRYRIGRSLNHLKILLGRCHRDD
jgi:RNA polymerase sigma factor (sigma-70 family)